MRDLARALSNIKLYHYDESFVAVCDERNGMLSFPLGLVYEAIERAIKAEAENERYKLMIKSITGGLDECMETVDFLEAENAKLRKVADAAKDHLNTVVGSRAFKQTDIALGYALADLDKEGE